MESAKEDQLSLSPYEATLRTLINDTHKMSHRLEQSRFIKKTDTLEVVLSAIVARIKSLVISERELIGQFTGIWPSSISMEIWIQIN